MQTILYAALFGGIFCAIVQIFVEMKVPLPFVAVSMMGFAGPILTHVGIIDALCLIGAGGLVPTPIGLGQAGYMAGAQIMAGNWGSFVECFFMNATLLLMGCFAGLALVAYNKKKG